MLLQVRRESSHVAASASRELLPLESDEEIVEAKQSVVEEEGDDVFAKPLFTTASAIEIIDVHGRPSRIGRGTTMTINLIQTTSRFSGAVVGALPVSTSSFSCAGTERDEARCE